MPARQPTQREIDIAKALFVGRDPKIAAQYASDPRTQLASAMMTTGADTSPVAGGITEGVARALSGLGGGYFAKQQRDKYRNADNAVAADTEKVIAPFIRDAAGAGGMGGGGSPLSAGPNPNTLDAPPGGFISPNRGVQAVPAQPPPNPQMQVAAALMPQQQGAPQAPALAPNPPLPGVPPVQQPQRPSPASITPRSAPSTLQPANASTPVQASPRVLTPGEPAGVDRRRARLDAITQQAESSNNPNAVSPKGARGLMQVMPETARDPGFGIRPSNGTPEDDVRVGQEYRAAMESRYGGDLQKMWAAYNAGPGATDRRIRRYGANWLAHMPRETREYVAANVEAAGRDAGEEEGALTASGAADRTVDVPPLPAAPDRAVKPVFGDRVRSTRLQIVNNLLGTDTPNLSASMRGLIMDQFLDAGLTEDQASKVQREEDLRAQDQTQYEADVGLTRDQTRDLSGAAIDANQAATAQQYAIQQGDIEQEQALELQRLEGQQAEERARIEAASKAAVPRNLPARIEKELNEGTSTFEVQDTLINGFQDDFSGYGLGVIGKGANSVEDWMQSAGMGSEEGQARIQWWKQYEDWAQQIRHGRYGSALTDTEKRAWDDANFNMGNSPATIKNALKQRSIIAARAMLRRMESAIGGNYNEEQITALMGENNIARMREVAAQELPIDKAANGRRGARAAPAAAATPAATSGRRTNLPAGVPRTATDYDTIGGTTYYTMPNGDVFEVD